jgi:hypothetical protein
MVIEIDRQQLDLHLSGLPRQHDANTNAKQTVAKVYTF